MSCHGDRMSQQLINAYLKELATLRRIGGTTEGVTSEAFKDLLKAWARPLGFTFIPQHAFTTTAKVNNRVDGAIMLERFPIGYWEAKDEDDDLDVEIEKKFRRGYPKTNIIFEDTHRAVLWQHGKFVMDCAVTDGPELGKLLDIFFGYEREETTNFKKAVAQFKVDLPPVLDIPREQIDAAQANVPAFQSAAAAFLKQAKETINPSVTAEDVREMLIQHILTENIFAKVFGDDEFHRKNNVAQALYALEDTFFSGDVRRRTLSKLSTYYAAIESAAALITSHSEKWPAPGFADTRSSYNRLPFEVHRAEIAQRRVAAGRIVEALDVVEHLGLGMIARAVGFAGDPLGLQRGEEALHRGIVPDVSRSAHRTGDAIVGHQALELFAGVLAALVGMVQQGIGLAAPPDRHDQGVGDELGRHGVAHRPADDAARVQVDHGRNIQPAFGGPDVGEVGHPFTVRRVGGELAIEHIAGDHRPFAIVPGQPTPPWPRLQRLLAHQPFDAVQTA